MNDMSMWDGLTEDVATKTAATVQAMGEAVTGSVWGYLSKAATRDGFKHRLATCEGSLMAAAKDATEAVEGIEASAVYMAARAHVAAEFERTLTERTKVAEVRGKVYEGTSSTKADNVRDLEPRLVEDLVGKYLSVVFYNDYGVGADYARGRITKVNPLGRGVQTFEWQEEGRSDAYPVSFDDVYRIERVEEPTDPAQLRLFSARGDKVVWQQSPSGLDTVPYPVLTDVMGVPVKISIGDGYGGVDIYEGRISEANRRQQEIEFIPVSGAMEIFDFDRIEKIVTQPQPEKAEDKGQLGLFPKSRVSIKMATGRGLKIHMATSRTAAPAALDWIRGYNDGYEDAAARRPVSPRDTDVEYGNGYHAGYEDAGYSAAAKVSAKDVGNCATCGAWISYDRDSRTWWHDSGNDLHEATPKTASRHPFASEGAFFRTPQAPNDPRPLVDAPIERAPSDYPAPKAAPQRQDESKEPDVEPTAPKSAAYFGDGSNSSDATLDGLSQSSEFENSSQPLTTRPRVMPSSGSPETGTTPGGNTHVQRTTPDIRDGKGNPVVEGSLLIRSAALIAADNPQMSPMQVMAMAHEVVATYEN